MKIEELQTISNLFEGKPIECIWNSENEEYYFSIVDVISALTESSNPRKYWSVLKQRLIKEGSEVTTFCSRLKMKSRDGKIRLRDAMDTQGIFRLIESIPSPKAEPFKLWLAKLGHDKVDEVFDPSKGIDQMIDFYLSKGYDLEWIENRIKAIINRKKLTKIWQDNGITENIEYAILTNEIYKTWSGMKANEYKAYKGIRKESLRDNMTDLEIALTDLGEVATREIAKEQRPIGLSQNKKVAKLGGHAAKLAREDIEKNIGKSVLSSNNNLDKKYLR